MVVCRVGEEFRHGGSGGEVVADLLGAGSDGLSYGGESGLYGVVCGGRQTVGEASEVLCGGW